MDDYKLKNRKRMNRTKKSLFAVVLILALMMVFAALTGCVSDDSAKQATALEDKGYTVTANLEYTYWPDSTWIIEAEKQNGNVQDYVRIIYFSSEDSAIEHYNTVIAEAVKALEAERPDLAADLSHRQVSNIIVYGTTQGVKDVLG